MTVIGSRPPLRTTRRLFFTSAAIILTPTVAFARSIRRFVPRVVHPYGKNTDTDSYAGTNVGDGRYALPAIGTIVAFIAGFVAIMKTMDRKTHNKPTNKSKPFYLNTTREERADWFAHTRPWHRVAPSVIDAIVDGITNKLLLEVFVHTSMEQGLVARYEALGREDESPQVIRAQVSQILCYVGNRAMPSLAKALQANDVKAGAAALGLVNDTYEPAIALSKNQLIAYVNLATAWGWVGKRAECHDCAKRGLAELAKWRRLDPVILEHLPGSPDGLDQMEQQLQSCLAL